MAIETKFSFEHKHAPGMRPAAAVDLLGPLRGLVGHEPVSKPQRTWKGRGFNLIWRPNFGKAFGPKDFFLELFFTDETLDFTDVTGKTGIANRGLLQPDIFLGGIGYLQQINDSFDNSGQHFEPGFWANVPTTANPHEPASIVRMGSIPHGTTINLQGLALEAPKPQFAALSITPFKIGAPDDGETGLVHFDEEDLSKPSASRTDLARVKALTQPELTNPNLFLSR